MFPDDALPDRHGPGRIADDGVATFERLVAHGVTFLDRRPGRLGGLATGDSAPRENHAAVMDRPTVETGASVPLARRASTSSGDGLIRPL